MNLMIDIQKISNLNSLPKNDSIIKWTKKALDKNFPFLLPFYLIISD